MGTVFPGEDNAKVVIERAFGRGLSGIKLHCHVQCFDMNSEAMEVVYKTCAEHDQPLVMHVSREPKSPSYKCDPYELCSAEKLEQVVKTHPELKICVPHLGVDEFDDYTRLIEKYDNLWLDTAMVVADYFPGLKVPSIKNMRIDRIFYGSDFPNIPYAWDREIKKIGNLGLPEADLKKVMGDNAREFFSLNHV
ncbi:MAG: amidohydrolase family protein [Myxococcota bacterium]|nr:amidohydrolase family protein [Myxococcota bacterium]